MIHGNIKGKISFEKDSRIETKIINKAKNTKYKIYKIKNARLYTDRVHDTAIILDNFIVDGPSFQLRSINNAPIEENIVFKKGTPRIKKKLNGTVLSLLTGGAGNHNYWHWLYDVLPRLALCGSFIDLIKINFILLPDIKKKFQMETLEMLNIPKQKLISSEFFRHISCNELIITDHPYVFNNDASNEIQNIPTWIFEWLRKNFISKPDDNHQKINLPKKIYIDRSDSSSNVKNMRKITNEDQIKEFLKQKGFESVALGNIDFKHQVQLFNNAEIIVGLHGAAFGSLCFCKPKTKVIEIKSTTDGKIMENIAINNGLSYRAIKCEAVKYKIAQLGHINVSIDLLKKAILELS